MAQNGRPKLPDEQIRSVVMPVRLSPGERDILKANGAERGLSISDYIRHAALNKRLPKPVANKLDAAAIKELGRIGNNLNQLTKKLNQFNQVDSQLLSELHADFKKLYMEVL